MTIEEVLNELKEIVAKLESATDLSEEEIKELEEKADELEQKKNELMEKAEKRKNLLDKVKRGTNIKMKEEVPEQKNEEGEKMDERNILSSKEYRSAFLKTLQKKTLTNAEERAMTSAANSVGTAIPTELQNNIIEKLYEEADLLKEIELLHVKGNITFAVEATPTDANIHTEGATINEDGDVVIPVSLTTYEITKYITISRTVSNMTIDAFEKWLTNMIAKRIARKIVKLIINGTGTNQPKGVANANTWGNTNSVTVAKTASLAKANVLELIKLLPGGYDKNGKWLMSKKTLLGDFRPLQDKSTDDFFIKENGKYYIEGYEVMLDEDVTEHEAILGDFKMYVGNLADEVTVDTDKKLSSNSFEYLGCANFDGKPAIGEAFVKLIKATN